MTQELHAKILELVKMSVAFADASHLPEEFIKKALNDSLRRDLGLEGNDLLFLNIDEYWDEAVAQINMKDCYCNGTGICDTHCLVCKTDLVPCESCESCACAMIVVMPATAYGRSN